MAQTPSSQPRLEIRLLGPFRLSVNGEPVDERVWTRRKAKTLLKLLALQPHHQLHREQVMEMLWPEQDTEAALNNLHKTIHAARRALEPQLKSGAESNFLVTHDQQITLRAAELWIDVEAFEQRASEALKSRDVTASEAALELYAGDLLSEDLYEDWAAARREQLRLLHQKLLVHLATLYETSGNHPQSIERYHQLITLNPSNEDAHRHLMRLYVLSGNRYQALQQYQHCCEALRRELDAEPEPATTALFEQISAGRLQTVAPVLMSPPAEIVTITRTENTASPLIESGNGKVAVASEPIAAPVSKQPVATLSNRWSRYVAVAVAVVLLGAVGWWLVARSARPATIDSLVVLPFAHQSADTSLEYLSDGITESVINNLSQLPALRVLARTTSFRYKGQTTDPQNIGRDLKVHAVLTGKVQQRGEMLIVQADLVNVSDGSQLWGAQYNRRLADIYTVQEEISREITDKLRLRLTAEEEKRLAKHPTTNAEAYQSYLRGRYHWNRRTVADIRKSIEHFQQAIASDPAYALAHAGLADAYISLANSQLSPNEANPLGKAAAMKALELDDNLAEAHTSLAAIKWRYEWKWDEAAAGFKRAIELNPNYPTARQWYGLLLIYQKKFEAGRAELLKAQQLDPLSLAISGNVGLSYYFARQYDAALSQLRRTVELDQNFPYAHFFLGWTLEQQRDYPQAIAAFQRAVQIDSTPTTRAYLGHGYAVAGNRREAETILAELQTQSATRYVSPYYLGVICAGLGEQDKAIEYLQRGVADRSDSMVLLNVEPKFDELRSHPQFNAILRQVGLQP